VGYFTLNHFKKYTIGQIFLLGMSLWFYAYFNFGYLFIILASVCLNYGIYLLLRRYRETRFGKPLLAIGVLSNVGILIYYKYMDFFISNINGLFRTDIKMLGILLPLGISFFTFQQLSFVIDSYRGEVPDYDFLNYACFVTYFPQLIAGPIVTHDELVPQLMDVEKKQFNVDNMAQGIYIFSLGLAKKVLLADTFGSVVTYGFTTLDRLGSITALIVMLSYTIQIYFDFSGYCDMAIGIGKMMNIDLPLNFDSPYKALTITEFWARWHKTLTRFFTKYVYIPLGGNRKGIARTCINTMIVFLISGFWHGASWNFVLWGAMHGIFMVITRVFKKIFDKLHPALNWFITFSFVNVAWVFFRAETIPQALKLLKTLVSWNFSFDNLFIEMFRLAELKKVLSVFRVEDKYPPFLITAFFMVAFVLILGSENAYEKMKKFKPTIWNMLVTLFLFTWSVFSFAGISEFLYFNF
jgi:alginate O-acetyltransferase complex protein AlgI